MRGPMVLVDYPSHKDGVTRGQFLGTHVITYGNIRRNIYVPIERLT